MPDVEFEDWYAAQAPALLRFGYLLVADRDEAQDVCQAALVTVWLRWSRVRDQPTAYARRAVLNEVRSRWRWHRRRPRGTMPLDVAAPLPPDADLRADLVAALRSLTASQRQVLVLRYYLDLDVETCADLLGISAGTVKSQASKARDRMRELLRTDDLASVSSTPGGHP